MSARDRVALSAIGFGAALALMAWWRLFLWSCSAGKPWAAWLPPLFVLASFALGLLVAPAIPRSEDDPS